MSESDGREMYEWVEELFPICRSITGEGVRQTLEYLKRLLPPGFNTHEVPSGTPAFDWVVPKEWNIQDAWIKDPSGRKIVDFKESNLHVVGYSVPVDTTVSLEVLQEHLFSIPELPDAIPYVTSYYQERWGFCLPHSERLRLSPGDYQVRIDSSVTEGSLTYGDLLLEGTTSEEILISSYVCHPSLANNELSGPTVATALARWLATLPERRYTYRFVYIPETIGALVYLSRNLEEMQRNTAAGFVLTCAGDERAYSLLRSRYGDTLADKVARHVLRERHPSYDEYPYLHRGSDERQYGAPGVDLPVVSIMRSKYGTYPEYHSSMDDLSVVSPAGLAGSLDVMQQCLIALERNHRYRVRSLGEPQLGKRGLYPTMRVGGYGVASRLDAQQRYPMTLMNLLAYADGTNDLIDVANIIGVPIWELYPIVDQLLEAELLEEDPASDGPRNARPSRVPTWRVGGETFPGFGPE